MDDGHGGDGMWMKIIAPVAFTLTMAATYTLKLAIKYTTYTLALAVAAYTIFGIVKSKKSGVHLLNDVPNALRLALALVAGALVGYALAGLVAPWFFAIGVVLFLLSLLVNDEWMRDVFRRVFPGHGFTLALLGIDGAGKTTHAHIIAELYRELGRDVEIVPYCRYLFVDKLSRLLTVLQSLVRGTGVSVQQRVVDIEAYYFYKGKKLKRIVRMMLSLIDNILLYLLVVHPKVLRGKIVILDRFMWSTYIKYRALGYPARSLRPLWLALRPHYAIVFDVPGEVSYKRILARGEHIRYPPQLLETERKYYIAIAIGRGYPIVNTTKPIEEVRKEVTRLALAIMLALSAERRKSGKSKMQARREPVQST